MFNRRKFNCISRHFIIISPAQCRGKNPKPKSRRQTFLLLLLSHYPPHARPLSLSLEERRIANDFFVTLASIANFINCAISESHTVHRERSNSQREVCYFFYTNLSASHSTEDNQQLNRECLCIQSLLGVPESRPSELKAPQSEGRPPPPSALFSPCRSSNNYHRVDQVSDA